MKEIKLTGSILNNSNKVISEADADWRIIKEGCLIKFQDDNSFYQAIRVDPYFYARDYESSNPHILTVKDDSSLYIHQGDNITISWKEYELLTIFNILNGGRNYRVDDIIFIDGGVASNKLEDGIEQKCHLRVAEILPGGIINKVTIENKGKYIETPNNKTGIRGGSGTGGLLEVQFKLLDERAYVERDIINLTVNSNSHTVISLSYPIPTGVKEGKISVKKYTLTLSSNYQGKQKTSEIFDVIKDFTPQFGWPLLVANSFSSQTLINHSFIAIDKKVAELQNRIKELENLLEVKLTS